MSEQPPSADRQGTGLSRRDFSIALGALGALAAAGIAGYFLFRRGPPRRPPGERPTTRPRLRADLRRGRLDDLTLLEHGQGTEAVVCAVNPTGARILDHLDGEHGVEAIARLAAGGTAGPSPAAVACFVAQLGMMGFLAEPYYAVVFERTEVAS